MVNASGGECQTRRDSGGHHWQLMKDKTNSGAPRPPTSTPLPRRHCCRPADPASCPVFEHDAGQEHMVLQGSRQRQGRVLLFDR